MDNDDAAPSTSSTSRSRQSSQCSQEGGAIAPAPVADNIESGSGSDKPEAGASSLSAAAAAAQSDGQSQGGGSGASSTASTPTLSAKKTKIDIVLKPVGDAPILKQKRWSVDPDKEVGTIIQFIKKYLNLQAEHSLFVFVNQAFAPSPDQIIRNLYDCFGSDGKLILHYSKTVAWG